MSFDKVKTLRAAERFLELGKIPAAVKEYCKIVENEPGDFTALNMLGDLYVRVGNKAAAISCFQRIAEHYRDQDFGLKAIAMFKKIDRLKPHDIEIASNLADLYAQQDLVVEARAHYLRVAEAHKRAGAAKEGLDILGKIADLDPQNTEIRIKLAEGYLTEGMHPEAAACLTEAGQHLLARGSCDEALEAFARALDAEPSDRAGLKGLLAAHSARGTADEAAEIIERLSASEPDDIDLLSMLASALVDAEDAIKAEEATAALLAKEPTAYLRFVAVARLYLRNDKIEDSIRVIGGIAEQMLAEREEGQLFDLVNELLACDSDNVQALRVLVRAYWWQRDTDSLKAALERLAEAAQAAGLVQDERYALTQLNRLVPDQPHVIERLQQLGGAEETSEDMPEVESAEPAYEETIEAPDHKFKFVSEDRSAASEDTEAGWTSIPDMGEVHAESAGEMEMERGFTFEAVVAQELQASASAESAEVTLGAPTESADQPDRNDAIRKQELESVDFYIAQGYMDIALDTLDLLERQFGAHTDIESRRQQIRQPADAAPPSAPLTEVAQEYEREIQFENESELSPVTPAPKAVVASQPEPEAPANPGALGIDPGLAEVFEEFRASAESDAGATGNGDYETHYNLGLAYQEMDLFEEALEEFQMAANLVTPGDGTPRYLQCCNLLGHCFMQKGVPQLAVTWFNKGLNAAGASEDERQALRFDLGAAYEQVGDLDRAIEIFTEVYGINVSYRGVNERLRILQARAASGKAAPDSGRNQDHEQHVH
ncbi:MAG: tetratricopeptide repeat protein [Acidobacteriota bacterium]